ncbi:MAG: hypothetical protein J0M12_02115 [Deltaproteobacteria bacterium]|nr:hypothetical protein [Deltaproteobacteria bacterium]
MESATVPLAVGDLHLEVTPRGKRDLASQASGTQFVFARIDASGGILATRVLAVQDGELPKEPFARAPNGYAAIFLLRGAALVNLEYVEAPHFILVRPGSELPTLYKGAEALLVSMGEEGVFNPQSRLRISVPDAMEMSCDPKPGILALLGRTTDADVRTGAEDLGVSLESRDSGTGQVEPHTHWSGGELMYVYAGSVHERGGWVLNAGDLLVSGPGSRHGPTVGKEGSVTLTIRMGERPL